MGCHDFFKYTREWLDNYINKFPQEHGMHLIRPHIFSYVQFLRVVFNLIYDGRNFIPPFPALMLRDLKDMEKVFTIEAEAKNCEALAAFSMPIVISFSFLIFQCVLWVHIFPLPFPF